MACNYECNHIWVILLFGTYTIDFSHSNHENLTKAVMIRLQHLHIFHRSMNIKTPSIDSIPSGHVSNKRLNKQ